MSFLGLSSPLPSILALVSFVLLSVATVSVPLLKSIWIFSLQISATNGIHSARYGAWGYCLPSLNYCSSAVVGYGMDIAVIQAFRVPQLQTAIAPTLTKFLVLLPIAAGLTVGVTLCVLFLYMSKRHFVKGGMNCFPMTFRYARGLLAINSVALLITFLALVVQVAVAGTMSQRVKKLRRSDLTIVWGNSVYLTAVAHVGIIWNYVLLINLKNDIRDEILGKFYVRPHISVPDHPVTPNIQTQFEQRPVPTPPPPMPPFDQSSSKSPTPGPPPPMPQFEQYMPNPPTPGTLNTQPWQPPPPMPQFDHHNQGPPTPETPSGQPQFEQHPVPTPPPYFNPYNQGPPTPGTPTNQPWQPPPLNPHPQPWNQNDYVASSTPPPGPQHDFQSGGPYQPPPQPTPQNQQNQPNYTGHPYSAHSPGPARRASDYTPQY